MKYAIFGRRTGLVTTTCSITDACRWCRALNALRYKGPSVDRYSVYASRS